MLLKWTVPMQTDPHLEMERYAPDWNISLDVFVTEISLTMHVNSPDIPTRNRSHETKNGVKGHARPISGVGESPP
jgi:hypothetical protein